MPIIDTSTLREGVTLPENEQIYNGLDCCLTHEVLEAIRQVDSSVRVGANSPHTIYEFERALQAPVLDMMLRGFRIDQYERNKGIAILETEIARLQTLLNRFANAIWDKPLNANSPAQLKSFFFEAMNIPEIWSSKKGERKLSVDREALEKIDNYFHARPFVATILALRDAAKQLSVLKTEVDYDGRMRTSYNVAGTETGRFSSSTNAFGTGTNLQNISAPLRKIFVADAGYKICGIDLEQAESREVGWLSGTICGDWSYLDACYSGDLHTLVATTAWPELPWTGEPKADRKIADTPFYRHLTYRDMAKKLGHGCLTTDHEVFTRNGWVSITDKPREILTYTSTRLGDSRIEYSDFEQVSNWTDFSFTGALQVFEGSSISAQMTPDHRVPYKTDTRCELLERPAVSGPGSKMPLGQGYVGGMLTVPARLIVAFMSDGHQHTKKSMKFHFHKQRKIDRLIELCNLYGFTYRVNLPHIYVEGNLPKTPGWWMLEWSKESLDDFLDEYKFWDGHVGKTSVALFSKHKEHLEIIQTLGRIRGIGGNIQKPQTSGFGTTMYKLQQNNRKWAAGESIEHTHREVENERVLCPTVPSSWFYVRRNGKIFVTGNSNYRGLPPTMARHAKLPVPVVESFQHRYFKRFAGIPKWHRWVAQQLQTTQRLITPLGRQRTFFGRANDDTTLREAIAFSPQSATADRLNLILWRVWKHMPHVQLLAQVHDALYFQYPEHLDEVEVISEALSYFDLRLVSGDHSLVVPGEAKVGWNWGNFDPESNPDGLKKWKNQKDERIRTPILMQKL